MEAWSHASIQLINSWRHYLSALNRHALAPAQYFSTDIAMPDLQTDAERAATNTMHWLQSCNAYVILDSGGVYTFCVMLPICCISVMLPLHCKHLQFVRQICNRFGALHP